MAFSWLTFFAARQQLAGLLVDPGMVRWTDAELKLYVAEALRVWNCLTFSFKTEFTFTVAAGTSPIWISLGSLANSPRLRTLTDTDIYTLMEYHLGEPPTGGTWTGTSQFTIADLSQALQRYRDEIIQATNCNVVNIQIASTPGNTLAGLPDSVLDVTRARFVPTPPDPSTPALPPVTLFRTDEMAENAYQANYLQATLGTPQDYFVLCGGSPQFGVDVAPAVEGKYDLLVLQSGTTLSPPTATPLGIPDDFSWVAKFGALASNLGRESEATDRDRAMYCEKRYNDGIKLMQNTPWIQLARINNVPTDTPSVNELDGYASEWDSSNTQLGQIATAGLDTLAVMPDPNMPLGVTLSVLGNAPIPVADEDFVQVSRDVWDQVLDYAHFLALLKLGGYEFTQAQQLEKQFILAAAEVNSRLRHLGLFADVLLAQGDRQEVNQQRYSEKEQ